MVVATPTLRLTSIVSVVPDVLDEEEGFYSMVLANGIYVERCVEVKRGS